MSRLRIDVQAHVDLEGIWHYIAQDNAAAATRLIQRIHDVFRLIADQPLMGEARPELAADLRATSVGNYVVFFRPHLDGVDIARVIHGARDIDAIFERAEED